MFMFKGGDNMGLFSFFTAKKTKAELEEYIETLLTA